MAANDCEVYSLGIGESRWSFRWEPRYRTEQYNLTEIEAMARAVIAGNYEERRGPFWLTCKIHIGDHTYKMMNLATSISPFRARHYAPFVTIRNPHP